MSPSVDRSSICKSGLAHVCSAASARKIITLSCRSCDACREEEEEEEDEEEEEERRRK